MWGISDGELASEGENISELQHWDIRYVQGYYTIAGFMGVSVKQDLSVISVWNDWKRGIYIICINVWNADDGIIYSLTSSLAPRKRDMYIFFLYNQCLK